MKKMLMALLMLTLAAPLAAFAAPQLAWDASSGDVTGYRIYYGLSSGSYTSSKAVGNVTQYPLANLSLTENKTYYFVTRAYNSAGESGNSNEVSWNVPDATPPSPPVGITVQ